MCAGVEVRHWSRRRRHKRNSGSRQVASNHLPAYFLCQVCPAKPLVYPLPHQPASQLARPSLPATAEESRRRLGLAGRYRNGRLVTESKAKLAGVRLRRLGGPLKPVHKPPSDTTLPDPRPVSPPGAVCRLRAALTNPAKICFRTKARRTIRTISALAFNPDTSENEPIFRTCDDPGPANGKEPLDRRNT